MQPSGRVVSVFGVNPTRIGGGEVFARALSSRLAERGWESVLCYQSLPEGDVRRFLELPNVTFDVLKDAWKFAARPARDLAAILKRHPADILHLYFTGFLSPYPVGGTLARRCQSLSSPTRVRIPRAMSPPAGRPGSGWPRAP